MENIKWFIDILNEQGITFDKKKLENIKPNLTEMERHKVENLSNLETLVEENENYLTVKPCIGRTISGRIQFSKPNINGFSKKVRDCITIKHNTQTTTQADTQAKQTEKVCLDIVSEEPNIITHILGRKDLVGDIYGHIAREFSPLVLAMVVDTWCPTTKLCKYGKQVGSDIRLLLDANCKSNFIKIDKLSSNLKYQLKRNGKLYNIISWQRVIANSENALNEFEKPMCMLVEESETKEQTVLFYRATFLKLDDKSNKHTHIYRGTVDWGEDELIMDEDLVECIREDIKKSLIAYCYGGRKDTIQKTLDYIDIDMCLTLYEELKIKKNFRAFVNRSFLKEEDGNRHYRIGGEEIIIPYKKGDTYNKVAPVLMQHLGVQILDEFLGLIREAYIEGWFNIISTAHDEIQGEIDIERLKFCHPIVEDTGLETFLTSYFSEIGQKTLNKKLYLHIRIL